MDETLLKIGGRRRYAFRCLDEHAQIVEVNLCDHREAASAPMSFDRAVASTEVVPTPVTGDRVKCYLPAPRALLPAAEQRRSKYLDNGLERDHQFLKGRTRPMRRLGTPGRRVRSAEAAR